MVKIEKVKVEALINLDQKGWIRKLERSYKKLILIIYSKTNIDFFPHNNYKQFDINCFYLIKIFEANIKVQY